MQTKTTFPAVRESIPALVDFVGTTLENGKIKEKAVVLEKLRVEDVCSKLIEKSEEKTEISVFVFTFMGYYQVKLVCDGRECTLGEIKKEYETLIGDDERMNVIVRRLSDAVIGDDVSIKRQGKTNRCTLKKTKVKRSQLFLTMLGLVLGVLAGFAVKYLLPDAVSSYLANDIFGTVSTLFMNAMKMIVAPLVFFSIAASIADFGDLKTLGKIALKVFGCYLFTSVLAILVGYGTYQLFPIGDTRLASLVSDSAVAAVEKSNAMSVSIKDTILGIVPTNIVNPFLNSDMLQVIFVAALIGIAVSTLGTEHKIFKNLIISGNAVFSKITAIIVSFMPVAVFCSMAKMVIGIDIKSLASVILWVPVCYAGVIIMMSVYGVLLLIVGRVNPLKFFKGFFPASLTAFSLNSSNATIPMSVKMCDEKLGISKNLYSFSIPFGATVNMDGNCVVLVVSALFMAKIFGVAITPSIMFTLALSIILLSIGAPGVPGGCLVCIAFLLPQIGIPAEAISLIMGLYSLTGMALTCCNSTGDAVVTTIVARSEGMIDLKKFNSN